MKTFSQQIYEAYFLEPTMMMMHFMPAKHFCTLAESGMLHFGRIDLQDKDPNDGRLPPTNAEGASPYDMEILATMGLRGEAAAKFQQNHSDSLEPSRRRMFIHSWTLHEDESRWLWDVYGAKGVGVCIRTSVARLERSVGIGGGFPGHHKGEDGLAVSVELMRVPYSEAGKCPPMPTIPAVLANVSKSREFAPDKEARLLASISPDDFYNTYETKDRPIPVYRKVPVDLAYLLQDVVIGPNIGGAESAELATLADNVARSRIARRSALSPYL